MRIGNPGADGGDPETHAGVIERRVMQWGRSVGPVITIEGAVTQPVVGKIKEWQVQVALGKACPDERRLAFKGRRYRARALAMASSLMMDVIDPMQVGSAMPLFRQTSRRTLHAELVVRLLPQDFCHCQR